MSRRALTAALMALVSVSSGGAQQRPTFKARADLVTVQAAVESGSVPVTDLTAHDFELTDDGIPQQIDLIEAGNVPIDVSIVLDTSGSMRRSVEGLKSDAQAIAAMLQPRDRLRLITFAGDATEAFGFRSPGGDLDVSRVAAEGWTALFDAVALAMITPREPDRRHLIVVLTDGEDNSSMMGNDALGDLSKHTDAVLYAAVRRAQTDGLAPRNQAPRPLDLYGNARLGLAADPPPERHFDWRPEMRAAGDERPIRLMVENTGGIWDAMGKIERAADGARRAIDWFRSAYLLRYRATHATSAGWHAINVRVRRPGSYTIHARKGYFGGVGPSDAPKTRERR